MESEPKERSKPIGFRVSGHLGWLDNDYKLIYYVDYDKAMVNGQWCLGHGEIQHDEA